MARKIRRSMKDLWAEFESLSADERSNLVTKLFLPFVSSPNFPNILTALSNRDDFKEFWLRKIILKTADHALIRREMSAKTVEQLKMHREEFAICVKALTENEELKSPFRVAAFGAIEAAFLIGAIGDVPADIWQSFKNRQVKNANLKRRSKAEFIDEIIIREANLLWTKKPSFKGNIHGTATEIRTSVNRGIHEQQQTLQAQEFPKGWEPVVSDDREAIDKQIRRITSRLRRSQSLDK